MMRRDRCLTRAEWAAVLACTFTLGLAASAQATPLYDITGTWTASPPNADETHIAMDPSTGALSGTSTVQGKHFTVGGSEDSAGNATVTLNEDAEEYPPNGYTSTWTVKVGDGGHCMAGSWLDTNGVGGSLLTIDQENAPWTKSGETYSCSSGGSVISGVVFDERDLPAPGVSLKVTGTSDEGKTVSQSTTSQSDGTYTTEVPPGNYAIAASGEMEHQNGGKLSVRKSSTSTELECPGSASEATCTLKHMNEHQVARVSFTYTYCASSERLPKEEPPSGCPVIFIPGFLGSRIACTTGETWTNIPKVDFADMALERDGVTNAGAPGSCSATTTPLEGQEGVVKTAAGKDVYGAALEFLNRIEARGGTPTPENGAYAFPYDWRKSPTITLGALNKLVDRVLAKTGAHRVVLMAHSMGGLVTQAYIADPTYAEKVARAITLGTPYWGAPKSHTALLTSKSNEPAPELLGLDLFLSNEDLQFAARNMQGLYWLYPSADYGPWLKVEGSGYSGATLGGSQIDPWVASLGGTPALVNSAMAGHAALDGFKTNGVQYQVVVGSGVPTITSMEVAFNEFEAAQFVGVHFGSGDGTVPARSATQGAFEGGAPLGANVPISYVCGVDHVALPGNAGVQSKIEAFLLKGKAVEAGAPCPYTGQEYEFNRLPLPNHGAFASFASGARVATASSSMTLEQAFTAGLVQVIRHGTKTIVVTDDRHPVTITLTGAHTTLKVRALTSAGKGNAKGSGPARYYGPLSGTVTLSAAGVVKRGGKTVKPARGDRAPHTTARVTRRGRYFIVRLLAKSAAGIAGTYVRIGKAPARRYSKPLRLTPRQLARLRFASVDGFGKWEHVRRARIPR
ncbi:MAG: alpha/beta fold hydrolase [Solirubrobacteraceae bacterium]